MIERIYIGRRFKNDTDRLEKLFELWSESLRDRQAKARIDIRIRCLNKSDMIRRQQVLRGSD